MELFPDSVARLRRAVSHGVAIQAEWQRIAQPESHVVRIDVNEDGTQGVAKTFIPAIAKNEISLQLGELFYQLRSALDGLIYQAAVYDEGCNTPPTNGGKFEFPICADEKKFKRNAINLPPFPSELRNWLLSIQPYIAKHPSHPNYTLAKYLNILHDCARIDRHRKLHIVGGALSNVDLDFLPSPGLAVTGFEFVNGDIFEREDVFLRFRLGGFTPGSSRNLKLKIKFGVQISIEDVPVPNGSTTGNEMTNIVEAVDFVVRYFKDAFGGNSAE